MCNCASDYTPPSSTCNCCQCVVDLIDPKLFKALSDPTRLTILARLACACRPSTVTEIACCTPIDVSVVSRHLTQLREAGIVCCKRSGKEVRYALCCIPMTQMLRDLADALESCCGANTNVDEPN